MAPHPEAGTKAFARPGTGDAVRRAFDAGYELDYGHLE
jgi:hypothetical protein